jgi:cytoskeleton protein RodZ
MSEEPVTVTTQLSEIDQQTAGMLLRKAREAAGLQVAALAAILKVPVRKLEALEADRQDELTDVVFVRALAASVCRALKMDAAPVLSRLPHITVRKFEREDCGISMPERATGFYYQHLQAVKAFVTKPAFVLVLILLVAALVVRWFPESADTTQRGDATEKTAAALHPGDVVPPIKEAVPLVDPASAASAVANTNPVTVSPVQVQAPTAAASAVVALGTVPRAVVAAASDVVVFKAKASAWIRVTDAQGTVQFEKVLASGESGTASGQLPLSVILGNAAATDVVVRGQPFGLDAFTKENVARFEVK